MSFKTETISLFRKAPFSKEGSASSCFNAPAEVPTRSACAQVSGETMALEAIGF